MSKIPEVIIVYETVLRSLLRDAGTLATLVSLIGIGVYLESAAMQWLGALIGMLVILSKALNAYGTNRLTVDQARKRLDEIERG